MRTPPRSKGQVLVIFALSIVMFTALCAVVVDVAWYWANSLRMQRAADAAALAGVVYLPGNEPTAITTARAEATKNGYIQGVDGVTVAVGQDPHNNRRLDVEIDGGVPTFFMRLFGIETLPAERTASAEYVLPVPMGSPESYYGTFGTIRTPDGGTTDVDVVTGSTAWTLPGTTPAGNWTNPGNALSEVDSGASATKASTTNPYQQWGGFGTGAPTGAGVTLDGIEVAVRAASTDPSGCALRVSLSWNSGTSWTSTTRDVALTSSSQTAYTVGSPTDKWGRATWTGSEAASGTFRVRIEYRDPGSSCTNGYTASVDWLKVRVHWRQTTTTFIPDAAITGPSGQAVNARGFWGTMLSQGAEDINGDAYLPKYEVRTGTANASYDTERFYDYAVEMPAGTTNGTVSVFDPVFCATASSGQFGTGDRWFSGSSAVSAFYTIYDTKNTLYDLTDDEEVEDSGALFRGIAASDTTLNGPTGVSSCAAGDVTDPADGRYWHNRWWTLATGLTGGAEGTTYRIRTATTDPASPNAQLGANAQNSFALHATASGGSPRMYGLGAMQTFSPLPGGSNSTFYLARIDEVHAGKTVVIGLWDPGDTGALSAAVSIMIPTAGGYTPANLTWSSAKGTANSGASNCNGRTGSGTSITTNTGNNQQFNGCWVTIEVPVPNDYVAPQPPGESEAGWWKIRYAMGGSAGDVSLDVTTWQVSIRGNPVHLVLP